MKGDTHKIKPMMVEKSQPHGPARPAQMPSGRGSSPINRVPNSTTNKSHGKNGGGKGMC